VAPSGRDLAGICIPHDGCSDFPAPSTVNAIPEARARDHEALFGRARDGVAVLGHDWRIRYANASLLEILDLLGSRGGVTTFWDAVPEWEHTPEADLLRDAMQRRAAVTVRVERDRGGGYVWEVTAEPVDGGDLRVRLRNVTARAEMEALEQRVTEAHASLADRERRLEEIVAGAPVALALLDAQTLVVLEANSAYAHLLDEPWSEPGAVLGHPISTVLPNYDETGMGVMLETVRETGEPFETDEFLFTGFRRGPAWFRLSVKPLGTAEGGGARFLLILAVEVTGLVRARREVEAERRALFDVLDTLPVGVIVAEAPGGRTVYLNPAAVALGGRSAEALSAAQLGEYTQRWEIFRPDGTPFAESELPLSRALRGDTVRDEQMVLRLPDGGARHILVSGVPLRGAGGEVERGMVAFYDVTDQLGLERALVERTTEAEHAAANAALRAEESRALREMGRALVSSLDPDDVLRLAAQNAMELLGGRGSFVATPLSGSHEVRVAPALGVMAQMDGTVVPLAGSAAELVLREGTQRFNVPEHLPEGSALLPLAKRLGIGNLLLVPVRAYGEPLGVLGVVDRRGGFGEEDARLLEAFADSAALAVHNARLYAGERHRAEVNRALLRAAEALTSTLDPAEVMERIVALAGELVGADGGGLTLLAGEKGEEVRVAVASGLLEPLRGMGGRTEGSLTEEAFRLGGPTVFSADDDPVHPAAGWLRRAGVEHYAVCPLHAGGERLGLLGLVRGPASPPFTVEELEILALLGDQAALAVRNARLYERAQAASEAKSGFLATMSHELRTPLNALEGYSSLLEEGIYGPVNEAQLGALARMRRARAHLVELIDQVLDVARVEAGTKRVKPELVVLPALVRDVAEALRGAAEARGLSMAAEVADDLPSVRTDPGMVRQILVNLVGNAVKFTERGGITVRLRTEADAVLLEVADTGPGIPAELHERVFESFFQVDPSTTRREGGVGLGLALSREFARLLGGELTLRSAPGEGTTFTLSLPVAPSE
jgi:signal transduction histidine kinase/PAS domain-containing protein